MNVKFTTNIDHYRTVSWPVLTDLIPRKGDFIHVHPARSCTLNQDINFCKPIEEMEMTDREKDVQNICKQILEMSPEFWDNPNGGYEYTCPICLKTSYGGNPMKGKSLHIDDIKHDGECAYLIAKDLMTNL